MASRRFAVATSVAAALTTAGLLVGATGCALDGGSGGGPLRVVAALYPFEFLAERVGGEHVSVTGLAPPGVEAHDLELTPTQVAEVSRADLVIHIAGFQPVVDDAIDQHARHAGFEAAAGASTADADTDTDDHHTDDHTDDDHGDDRGDAADDDHGHDHDHAADLHVWLDPGQLAEIGDRLAAALAELDPAHAAAYTGNAAALRQELGALDTAYAEGLADCQRREIVVSHAAFGHLAQRYDLRQIAITGLSPETEPTPRRLAEVIEDAQAHHATTIYFETLVSPAVADLIAAHTGAETAVLNPIEGLPADGQHDYFSLMRDNLDALRAGLGCR